MTTNNICNEFALKTQPGRELCRACVSFSRVHCILSRKIPTNLYKCIVNNKQWLGLSRVVHQSTFITFVCLLLHAPSASLFIVLQLNIARSLWIVLFVLFFFFGKYCCYCCRSRCHCRSFHMSVCRCAIRFYPFYFFIWIFNNCHFCMWLIKYTVFKLLNSLPFQNVLHFTESKIGMYIYGWIVFAKPSDPKYV